MKNENKLIYYGILFSYLYFQIYSITSKVLISPILYMQWNVHLVPILLSLIIMLLSVWFYKVKNFPKMKLWFIILIVLLSIFVSLFNIPNRFYLLGGNSIYSIKTQSTVINYILICGVINTSIFLVISYIKYLKLKKTE
jgi:RsiW-degrading membrane proteinase PrsW (M82 family)